MQIWPAIDLRDGKCVRLEQGDYARETVFGDDPVKIAKRWVDQGARRLHLVDLDAAKAGKVANFKAVQSVVESVGVPCQFGGGVRGHEAIEQLLAIGLSRLVVGTRALKDPDWFRSVCDKYPSRLVLGLDARDGLLATDGWMETSQTAATDLAAQLDDVPVAAIVYTDIARDGMLAGPNFPSLAAMCQSTRHAVIASGGVTTLDDVRQLAEMPVGGCIIGRSLYEGKLQLAEAIAVARDDQSAAEGRETGTDHEKTRAVRE